MLTVKDQFVVGIDGVLDFEVFPATIKDNLDAVEQAMADIGEDASVARGNLYKHAKMLRVGGKAVTVEQVGALLDIDYDLVERAVGELKKKLLELKPKKLEITTSGAIESEKS